MLYDILKEEKQSDKFFDDKIQFLLGIKDKTSQKVADNNLTMPPKSTWFDPKPLDGIVAYDFD